ncbi:MAG: M28 family peptidase [Thermoplasmata archaeon]
MSKLYSKNSKRARAFVCFSVFCSIIMLTACYVVTQPRKFPIIDVKNIYEVKFSGELANKSVKEQCSMGFRIPGSRVSKECATYISYHLIRYGFEAKYQNFTAEHDGKVVNFSNVIGAKYGLDNKFTNMIIVLGAHYDTRPFADRDKEENKTKPILGANDGASGVAVLLELARVLSFVELGISIELVFFDGEDLGKRADEMFYGSRYYANTLSDQKRENILAFILVDMVGDDDLQIFKEKNSDKNLISFIWKVAKMHGCKAFQEEYKYAIIDDHIPLKEKGVPVIDIIDFDYPYWHTLEDTPDKVSAESLEQVGKTLEASIYAINESLD